MVCMAPARWLAIEATVNGPPPPCRMRTGRQNQKQRTRNAIVSTARDLVRQGRLPSVAEVAEAALISPATAYRYFPDQLSLLRAALQEAKPRDEQIATPVPDATVDPAE